MANCKSVVLFLKIISLFIVQRNFGNIIYDYVQKYDTLKTDQLRKYEKLKTKIRKAELDATFLSLWYFCKLVFLEKILLIRICKLQQKF